MPSKNNSMFLPKGFKNHLAMLRVQNRRQSESPFLAVTHSRLALIMSIQIHSNGACSSTKINAYIWPCHGRCFMIFSLLHIIPLHFSRHIYHLSLTVVAYAHFLLSCSSTYLNNNVTCTINFFQRSVTGLNPYSTDRPQGASSVVH